MEKSQTSNKPATTSEKKLPSMEVLFKESWELFQEKALGFLLTFVAVFLSFITLSLIVVIPSILASLIDKSVGFIVLGVLLIISSIFFIIIGAYIKSVVILMLDDSEPFDIFRLLKKSKPFIGPLIILSLLTGFLAIGGYFFFFFPGLLIAFFLSFATFEVVLGQDKSPLGAIKSSVAMIVQNFGGIFVRSLIMTTLYLFTMFGLGRLTGIHSGFLGLLTPIISTAFAWYMNVYFFVMYKQVKALKKPEKKSIAWMWIISSIGWLIGILIIVIAIVAGVASKARNIDNSKNSLPSFIQQEIDKTQQMQDDFDSKTDSKGMMQYDYDGMTGEIKPTGMTEKEFKMEMEQMMEKMQKEFNVDTQDTSPNI
ncbi:hypothetical protein KC726_04405 [Candidatus Woesebacteria bacterium]|nr:hypothetical protein [Candidatus Woesebacteria bacterium]